MNFIDNMKKPPVFLCDLMLRRLARWLRILGIGCVYAGDEGISDDDEILKFCLKRGCVLLTRDELLYRKAGSYVKTVLMDNESPERQVKALTGKFGLKLGRKFLGPSLCPQCGGRLERVGKPSVKGKVFPKVYELNRSFNKCADCGKIYWKGSHFPKLESFHKKVA
ncbi:DUF5615 family PIN-like protein [Candidatus Micrarchaeota archaeon]|nr:DUF5615 family PIN-like protein [Candidatus Micrarchaeota archaeon]